MKTINYFMVGLILTFFCSCAVVGGIFKAGMYWGIFLVVGIIALIIYLISRRGKS